MQFIYQKIRHISIKSYPILGITTLLMLFSLFGYAQTRTTSKDTTRNNKDARRKLYAHWNDRIGNRLNNKTPRSPLFLKDPKNVSNEFKLDSASAGKMSVYEKLGDHKNTKLDFRNPTTMTYEQFKQLQDDRVMNSLMHDYTAKQDGKGALGGRGLLPKLELPPVFDRIFGGNGMNIKPNGFVLLDFGVLHQNVDNPAIPINQRRTTNFIFNEQININFNGKIGDKLGLVTNFDTKASFNFENQLKLNYKAEEQDLIQNVQLGNLQWQLPTQLITGVQNLFGLKTDFRLGRLNATFVASQQRSKQQCITLRGGVQNRPFEIKADQYDENRNFFLSQFFRDNYERSLKNLPMITSGVTVTRIEVYVTNRANNTETLRNIVGFADLGENNPYSQNSVMQPIKTGQPVDNNTNGLFRAVAKDNDLREVDKTTFAIENKGLRRGDDYDILRGARRLRETEFRFHPELGYISLVSALKNDEILAVSYEYTLNGQPHKVGEMIEDYQARRDDQVLILKLLKSATIRNNTNNPMWNLMMKNVYSLNATQVSKQGFQFRIIYKDDLTGIDNPMLQEGRNLQNVPLLRVMNLDKLNPLNDPQPDGNFDFIEGTTIDSRYGKIIFPVLEPFGSSLAKKFEADEDVFKNKYVFNELYRTTQIDAQQLTEKNKFFLKGSYQGGAGGAGVQLPYGVSEKSVTVKAAGAQLQAGTDFVVEAQIGQVRIINESVMNSGRDIEVCYEQPDLFQNQTRTLLGTRLEYTASPDLKIGATVMRLRETPAGYISRTAIGNDPVNNTMLGADIKLRKDSRWLTRMIDALPFLQTKEISSIQLQAEFAHSIAGVSPQTKGRSFIDDFESARVSYDLTRQPTRWKTGATPQQFPQGTPSNPLEYTYNRARISAYSIDNTFYPGSGFAQRPSNLTDKDAQNFYEKYFLPRDIFPGRSQTLIQLPEATLDIAYFPQERGMYNFNTDLDPDGHLKNPAKNFGSITRAVSSDPDFDNANIENITFWMMDPFIDGENGVVRDGFLNQNNRTGGKLHINLGEISEDIMKNGRYDFENGLPITERIDQPNGNIQANVAKSAWGYTTKQQYLINAFSNQPGAREKQDVGLDGMSNADEKTFFKDYLQKLPANLKTVARSEIESDPSADDFEFYFNAKADSANKKIIERYKRYMGVENNSPEVQSAQYITPASTTVPDAEDLNIDNTINDQEQYYEYDVDLRPNQFEVGKGYVVDRVNAQGANWYLFRIPIREFARKYGGINGFKNIRFMRMYMTGWQQPVVLRFAQLQMVSTQYRKYTGDLNAKGLQEVPEPYDAQFTVATVNAEENSAQASGGNKYVYGSPPGFDRDIDYTTTNQMQLNEQSMSLCVTNLKDGDSRAAFKNVNLNLLFRKKLKMFIHLQNDDNESGQVSAFLRLGTDVTQNYYDVEVTNLQATPQNIDDRNAIWPQQNELDIAFADLISAKSERDKQLSPSLSTPYTITKTDDLGRIYRITVVGRPDLSAVMMLMVGVRNPRSADQLSKNFCIWVDELHTEGVEQSSGSAGMMSADIKLADFATIQATGRFTTFGFGSIQQKIADRSRDYGREFSISGSVALDKILPQKWGLKIPLYVNYDNKKITPHFNPLDPDMPLETALANISDDARREEFRRLTEESAVRKGFNFSNVRKVKVGSNAKSHFYDVENLSLTYAYNEYTRSNSMIADYSQKQYKGGIAYQYSFPQKPWEPFKNVKSLDRPYLEILKNFNLTLLPSNVAIRFDADRSFVRTVYRSSDLTTNGQLPMYEKYFLINRRYDFAWNLTKNLTMTYKSATNAAVDEPFGDIDTKTKSDSIWRNIKQFGRAKNYNQEIRFTYRLPLDQIPLLDWMTADYSHNIMYQYQANSLGIRDSLDVPFGNTIRNSRERGIRGQVDFVKLYNKIRYLNFANRPSPQRKNFARSPGDDEDIVREPSRLAKNLTRFLMAVRGIDVSYTLTETSTLPGFLPDSPNFFGLDGAAPGTNFILGAQNPDFNRYAAARGWLSKSTQLNQPFSLTRNTTFTAGTRLEPFKDFKIQIQARYTRGDEYREYYRPSTPNGDFETQSAVRNGNFQMTFMSFKTAFAKINDDHSSPVYDQFKANRQVVLDRLAAVQKSMPDYKGGEYTLTSQDVLIPAFFAAYNGKDPNEVRINPFLDFPLPNWRVDYSGLSQLKPFSKIFSSFTLEHDYKSVYSVGNFTSSLSYGALYVNMAVRNYPTAVFRNEDNQFIPVFAMSTITLSEKFSPLIGIRAVTKSRINLALRYSRERDVALNLANAQVAELFNKEISVNIGFTKNNVRIPFKINGKSQRLKNDLKVQCTLTLRDTRSIQRRFDEAPVPIAGNINFQLRPQINYDVSKLWSIQFYFDRTFNDPLVSNSFRRATTAGGIQVRFNVAEL